MTNVLPKVDAYELALDQAWPSNADNHKETAERLRHAVMQIPKRLDAGLAGRGGADFDTTDVQRLLARAVEQARKLQRFHGRSEYASIIRAAAKQAEQALIGVGDAVDPDKIIEDAQRRALPPGSS